MDASVDEDATVFHGIDYEVRESFQRGAARIQPDLQVGEWEALDQLQGGIDGVNEMRAKSWALGFILVECIANIVGCLRLNDQRLHARLFSSDLKLSHEVPDFGSFRCDSNRSSMSCA